MENKVITAQQLLKKYGLNSPTMINTDTAEALMIEFAKIHVDEALEKAAENAEAIEGYNTGFSGSAASVDRDSILNAYPLSNIK